MPTGQVAQSVQYFGRPPRGNRRSRRHEGPAPATRHHDPAPPQLLVSRCDRPRTHPQLIGEPPHRSQRPLGHTSFDGRDRVPGGLDGHRMLLITLVDRIGSGLWASLSVLYVTYVAGLPLAEVGTLVAAAGAIGIAGAPMGGRLADRFPLTRVLIAVQVLRALASFTLLTTDQNAVLLACMAVGGFGDGASSIITKLYATRVAGPDRVRYQAVHRRRPTWAGPWAASPWPPP